MYGCMVLWFVWLYGLFDCMVCMVRPTKLHVIVGTLDSGLEKYAPNLDCYYTLSYLSLQYRSHSSGESLRLIMRMLDEVAVKNY